MNNMLLKLYVKFQDLKNHEEGQDLVEYALVVALIAFGAISRHDLSGRRPQHRVQQHQHHFDQQHHLVEAWLTFSAASTLDTLLLCGRARTPSLAPIALSPAKASDSRL